MATSVECGDNCNFTIINTTVAMAPSTWWESWLAARRFSPNMPCDVTALGTNANIFASPLDSCALIAFEPDFLEE